MSRSQEQALKQLLEASARRVAEPDWSERMEELEKLKKKEIERLEDLERVSAETLRRPVTL